MKCELCEKEYIGSEDPKNTVCKECEEMLDEKRVYEEIMWEEQMHHELNNLYNYDEDEFCDGFTKY